MYFGLEQDILHARGGSSWDQPAVGTAGQLRYQGHAQVQGKMLRYQGHAQVQGKMLRYQGHAQVQGKMLRYQGHAQVQGKKVLL